MDIETLKTFLNVAHQGSFATTARASSIDPSLVSRAIAGLEKDLGVRLFHRSTRRMSLTEAGALYLGRVEAILDELEHAREEAITVSAEPRGTLRITASVAFGQTCLVPLIPEFHHTFPDVELELLLSDDNLDLVAERIDLAIRLAPDIKADVICTKLFTSHYRVCASSDYLANAPVIQTPEDISQHKALLFALAEFRTRWLFRAASGNITEVPVNGGIVISNALAIRESMLSGLGPALLADWLIDDDIAAGRCIGILPDYQVTATTFDAGAWLIYPSRTFLPNKVRIAIDFLKKHLN